MHCIKSRNSPFFQFCVKKVILKDCCRTNRATQRINRYLMLFRNRPNGFDVGAKIIEQVKWETTHFMCIGKQAINLIHAISTPIYRFVAVVHCQHLCLAREQDEPHVRLDSYLQIVSIGFFIKGLIHLYRQPAVQSELPKAEEQVLCNGDFVQVKMGNLPAKPNPLPSI